jgi:hypothetical protein
MSAAVDDDRLRVRESSPGTVLDEYLRAFGELVVDADGRVFEHRFPPDACGRLSYVRTSRDALGWIAVVGPRVEPLAVTLTPGEVRWDLVLRPGAYEPLLGEPVQPVVGRVVRASDALPRVHRALQSELAACESAGDAWRAFAEAVLTWLPGAPPIDPAVAKAVRLLEESDGGIAPAELAETLEMKEPELRRRFERAVGLDLDGVAGILASGARGART